MYELGGINISTRARIGILKKDGSIESIYCHHDGYLDGVGKILNDNYQNYNDVKEGELAVARAKQRNIEGWVEKRGLIKK